MRMPYFLTFIIIHMLKFINHVATIEVNKEAKAIQISFRNVSNKQNCLETMRIAASFCRLHRAPSYLLLTGSLDKAHCGQLYRTLREWLQMLEQDFQRKSSVKTKVAWLTNRDRFLDLSEVMRETEEADARRYQHVAFDLFFARQKAYSFLQAGILEASRQVL